MRSDQSRRRNGDGTTGGPGRSLMPVFSPPSKRELLRWVGQMLALDVGRLEELASGAVFCQILDAHFSDLVAIHKVNFCAQKEYEFVSNYKVLQSAFTAIGVTREINVQKLMRASPVECLDFLQFLHKFLKNKKLVEDYNPAERRGKSSKGRTDHIPTPDWMNYHFDVYGQPEATTYNFKFSDDGRIIGRSRTRSLSTSGLSGSCTSRCSLPHSRPPTASVDSYNCAVDHLTTVRELGHRREHDSTEAQLTHEHYSGTTSFSGLQMTAETVGEDRSDSSSSQLQSPSPTDLKPLQQSEEDFSSSATSSSSEFEMWNAEVPFGSRRRMLQALAKLKPGVPLADDYIIEAGNVDGKPHLRTAKHRYRRQEVVILKFYWTEEQFENTLDVHHRLSRSEHVCGIVQSLKTPRTGFPPCVVFEKGTEMLREWLKSDRPLVDRIWCLHQILTAVKDLHAIGVVHCDLKPSNVMFFADGVRWKLIDFDGAKRAGSERADSFTAIYAAPEAVLEYTESRQLPLAQTSLDLWSIGIIAYEILTGKRFFREDVALEDTCELVEAGKVEENLSQITDELQREFVSGFLMMEPQQRKPAAEMLQHGLFRSTSSTTTTM